MQLVGRELEIADAVAVARRCADDAAVHVLSVIGAAGVGKTSLVRAVIDRLGQDDWFSLRATAAEVDIGVPLFPFQTMVASLPPNAVPGSLRSSWAARTQSTSLTDADRLRQTVVGLLAEAERRQPVALAIDDTHHLDAASWHLVERVLRAMDGRRLLVVLASRPGYQLSGRAAAALARLGTSGRVDRIHVGELGVVAAEAIVRHEAPPGVDDATVSRLVRAGGGNPFFLTYVSRYHGEELPQAHFDDERRRLVERVIGPDGALRTVAQVLSMFGRVGLAESELIGRVGGLGLADIEIGLDVLAARGVLVSDGAIPAGFSFSHALLAEAVREGVGPGERRRLHREIARALLERRRFGEPVDLYELAWQVAQSGLQRTPEGAAVLSDAARATAATSPVGADAWYELAVGAVSSDGPTHLELRTEQVFTRAMAGDTGDAIALGYRTLAEAPSHLPTDDLRYALANSLYSAARVNDALAVLTDCAPSELSPRSAAIRAALAAAAGRVTDGRADYDDALRRVAAVRDPLERLSTLSQLYDYTFAGALPDDRARLREQSMSMLPEIATAMQAQFHYYFGVIDAVAGGSTDAAQRHRHLARKLVGDQGVFGAGGNVDILDVVIDWGTGAWPRALRRADILAEEAVADGNGAASMSARLYARLVRSEQGRPHDGLDAAVRDRHLKLVDSQRLLAARAAAMEGRRTGRVRDAIHHLEHEIERARALGAMQHLTVAGEILVELVLQTGDRPAAVQLATTLLSAVEPSRNDYLTMHGLRGVGIATGDADAFTEAGRLAKRLGRAVDEAKAVLLFAEHRGVADDALVDALSVFDRAEATPLAARTRSLLARHGVVAPMVRVLSGLDSELAHMVSDGRTNREIAAAVGYSVKTVEAHLSRIYRMLGCRNRVDLARMVADRKVRTDTEPPPGAE